MHDLLRELTVTARSLRRAPLFTFVTVATLALGLGAVTTVFSLVDRILLQPLPYADADRLVAVFEEVPSRGERRNPTAPGNYLDWRRESDALRDVTAARSWEPTLRGDGEPMALTGLRATHDLFELVGVDAALGRTFGSSDDPADAVVVIGHELWQHRYGGDAGVLGRRIELDGRSHTVIGVMPEGFVFPPFWADEATLWAPLTFDAEEAAGRSARYLRVFGRLAEDVALPAAQAELRAIGTRLARDHPNENGGVSVVVEPLAGPTVAASKQALTVMAVTVACVLLIACANVVHLLLVRLSTRRRELMIRRALGAGRWRVQRTLLVESLAVCWGGAGLGLLLSAWALDALRRVAHPDVPRLVELALDGRAVVFALAVGAALAVLFSTVLPRFFSGARAGETLRAPATSGSGGRIGGFLVIAEVALSLTLLIGAGLMVESLLRAMRVDPGFDAERAVAVSLSLTGSPHGEEPGRARFFDEVVERAEAAVEIERAAFVNHVPIGGDLWRLGLYAEGMERSSSSETLPRAGFRVVTPGYFEALGVPLSSGRSFDRRDHAEAEVVVVVNETLAARFWPGQEAVGKRLHSGLPEASESTDWMTVIGVVGDVHQTTITDPVRPEVYFTYAQDPVPFFQRATLVARTDRAAAPALAALRRVVTSVASDVPVTGAQPLTTIVARSLDPPRFNTSLLSLLALLALVLAAVGMYGVIGYTVSLRRREIGVRMALGAGRRQIFGHVVGRSLALVSGGLAVGFVGALAFGRVLHGMLFETSALDLGTASLAMLGVAAVAACAAFVPARRATRTDPIASLRPE